MSPGHIPLPGVATMPGCALPANATPKASGLKAFGPSRRFPNTTGFMTSPLFLLPQFLKDPATFSKLGARPPKGILMEGDPGGCSWWCGCGVQAVGRGARADFWGG